MSMAKYQYLESNGWPCNQLISIGYFETMYYITLIICINSVAYQYADSMLSAVDYYQPASCRPING
jgi:hypothetical protein